MEKITGDFWRTQENKARIQIKTKEEQVKIQELLPGWRCVSYGYIPKTMEDIYVFEKEFKTEKGLTSFMNSDNIIKQLEIREVTND
jgi:hypothetical protein